MQENKSTLVTALYHHSPQEIIGGRGWDFDYFAAPFLNVLKLDQPIVIYTHRRMTDSLSKFLDKHFNQEYFLIDYNLENFKYSEKIFSIKRSSKKFHNDKLKDGVSFVSNDRNHHLCLSKLYWLDQESKINRFSTEKFFWIDAGLFHHGIFPEKYGGRERLSRQENNPSLYHPEHKLSIFKPQLIEKINNFTSSFLSLKHSEMPINKKMKLLLDVESKIRGYIVGGFFGGQQKYINQVFNHFDNALEIVLNNNILTLEEDLLSCVSGLCPELFQIISFNNWHHDIKGEPCYYGAGESSLSFYKIFKNLVNE